MKAYIHGENLLPQIVDRYMQFGDLQNQKPFKVI